jgi:predicted acetyltransferase
MTDSEPAPEFRRLGPDHLDEYRRVVKYAFEPEAGPATEDSAEDLAEKLGERFGVFVDETLCSVCKHYDFETRLRGAWVPLAGLAAVATPPEHRRQGYVGHLVAASLDRWRGTYPLSALWPFDRSFYRQFGWATANTGVEYTWPPASLVGDRTDVGGRFRRATPDDWAALQTVHEAHAEDRTLALRRDEAWWREKVLLDDDRPHAAVWERDGEARAYVVYEFEPVDDGMRDRRIDVRDMAFADHEARLAVLGYLADHDSQATEVVHSAEDETLLDIVPDPVEVEASVAAGPMVRIIDVADALSTTPYPKGASADLTVAVADRTADWNDDVFRLRVADGDGDCARVDAPRAAADVRVDIGTLSRLVVGYRDVRTLRRLGELDVEDETVAGTLEAVFPEETVYLRQFF